MPQPANLIDLFLTFRRFGGRPAFIHRTGVRRRVMDYAALDAQSRRMATLLAGLGVEKGERVALWGPNSPWWGVAFWGVLLRGAVVVPIDFSSDEARVAEILAHAGAKLLVQSSQKPAVTVADDLLVLEELPWRLPTMEPQASLPEVRPEETAELVYTSGTTGVPKGVILSHRNLMANLAQVHAHLPVVDPSFRFLSFLPLSHMFEQTGGFLAPLSRGAAVVYLATLKPAAIMEAFAEEEIHAAVAVPRLLQLLKGSIEEALAARRLGSLLGRLRRLGRGRSRPLRRLFFYPVQRRFGRSFRFFVSGGAPLDVELFRFWDDLGFVVLEGYGLTECSPVLAANTATRQVAGTVGRALPGVELRIADGEIQAQGDNVFAGYYRNPQATAEAFSADGWFRSGDIGELDDEGWLSVKGRIKEMIVTGAGLNVFPDRIEALLDSLAGVREACVIGLDRGRGEEVHAVLLTDGSGRPAAEIVAEANAQLDAQQRITGFSVWPEADFPRTATLKVRKFLVRERLQTGRPTGTAATGDRLATLIAAVTGCAPAEIKEESYLVSDLGLTSIARLELVSAIERQFRLDLDESLIDPQTTVARLRELVRRGEQGGPRDHFRFWSNAAPVRLVRRLADRLLHFPLLRLCCTVEVRGLEHLAGLDGPVLFVANHLSYLDQPVIMRALPPQWRYRTATAAWAEFFFNDQDRAVTRFCKRLSYEYCVWTANIFPLSQLHGFRRALHFMGRLADHRINVLIFPEGERSRDGRLLPFRPGLGLMAEELDIPLVPVRIRGLERVLPRGASFPRRGKVEVSIGAPLLFAGERPEAIVDKMRAAIEAL